MKTTMSPFLLKIVLPGYFLALLQGVRLVPLVEAHFALSVKEDHELDCHNAMRLLQELF